MKNKNPKIKDTFWSMPVDHTKPIVVEHNKSVGNCISHVSKLTQEECEEKIKKYFDSLKQK